MGGRGGRTKDFTPDKKPEVTNNEKDRKNQESAKEGKALGGSGVFAIKVGRGGRRGLKGLKATGTYSRGGEAIPLTESESAPGSRGNCTSKIKGKEPLNNHTMTRLTGTRGGDLLFDSWAFYPRRRKTFNNGDWEFLRRGKGDKKINGRQQNSVK